MGEVALFGSDNENYNKDRKNEKNTILHAAEKESRAVLKAHDTNEVNVDKSFGYDFDRFENDGKGPDKISLREFPKKPDNNKSESDFDNKIDARKNNNKQVFSLFKQNKKIIAIILAITMAFFCIIPGTLFYRMGSPVIVLHSLKRGIYNYEEEIMRNIAAGVPLAMLESLKEELDSDVKEIKDQITEYRDTYTQKGRDSLEANQTLTLALISVITSSISPIVVAIVAKDSQILTLSESILKKKEKSDDKKGRFRRIAALLVIIFGYFAFIFIVPPRLSPHLIMVEMGQIYKKVDGVQSELNIALDAVEISEAQISEAHTTEPHTTEPHTTEPQATEPQTAVPRTNKEKTTRAVETGTDIK